MWQHGMEPVVIGPTNQGAPVEENKKKEREEKIACARGPELLLGQFQGPLAGRNRFSFGNAPQRPAAIVGIFPGPLNNNPLNIW